MARSRPTTYAYFDTSALIKRYVDEPGRPEVSQLLRESHCIVSAVLPVEVHSALRRRVTEGTLKESQVAAILRRFTADRTFWIVIEVSREVLGAAEALCATHPLRALDAIHVASAQLFSRRIGASGFTFVSADIRQTGATEALRIPTRHIEV
jgi:predicted nucleic acid-binding protein